MVSAGRRSFGHYSPAAARLPRLVARGYLAAVSGPAVLASFLLAMAVFGNPLPVTDSLSEWISILPCRPVPSWGCNIQSPAVTISSFW